MAQHNLTGKKGEQTALAHLLQKGHRLLAQNYRFGRDEVDIITQVGKYTVFTEVKTRKSTAYGQPEEFVGPRKRQAMKRVADQFMHVQKLDTPIRFDVIAITQSGNQTRIYHIEDAFFNEEGNQYN